MSLTQVEQEMNEIVPKMLRKFGKTTQIGLSIPNGPGCAGGKFRVVKRMKGFGEFWLGGGDSPNSAYADAMKRYRKRKGQLPSPKW